MNAKIPRFFGTYKEGRSSASRTSHLVQDAIRATTAGRNLFLDAVIGQGYLMQRFGGTEYANNNPTYHLIEEAKRIWPDSSPFIVSLGAGQLGALPHPVARGTQELLNIQRRICSDCEDTHRAIEKVVPPELYHRFNVEHGLSDKEIWSLTVVEDVISSTDTYCDMVEVARSFKSVGEALDETI
ncbi:hypothetical protein DL96DRAFT_1480164 [Flagelloscypha sp. PMI_526]|jgi:hypothetical protein|nr:hypothetical protein DL96DRAFT_1480164 [Flagelloscypha sp. PMI_526]